jgi:hypothetical protein
MSNKKNVITIVIAALALVLVVIVALVATGVIKPPEREPETVVESKVVVVSQTNAQGELEYMTVVETTKPVAEAKISLCKETDHVIAVPSEDFNAIIPKDSLDSIIITPHLSQEEWVAPVEKGTVLGTATVTCAGAEIGTIDLVAQETCKRSFFLLIWSWITHPICLAIYAVIALAIIAFAVWNVRMNYRRRKMWSSRSRRR